MTYIINIQMRSDLPNGDVFNYRYEITEIEAEKLDDVGVVFENYFAQFMKEYTKVKDDIKLPPLPKGDIAADTCPVRWVHTDQQLESYALEAIEADRKRRSEKDLGL